MAEEDETPTAKYVETKPHPPAELLTSCATVPLIATVLVVALSIMQWKCKFCSVVLFYALFPGNIFSLLITGGHGGTVAEEAVAPYVGALTNIAVYSAFFFGCAHVYRRLNS